MTTHELILRWLVAFFVTQIVECPIYVRIFRVHLGIAFAASAITHPVVTFVIPKVWSAAYLAIVTRDPSCALSAEAYDVVYGILAEGFAIATEALWLRWRAGMTSKTSLTASFCANAVSCTVGGLAYLFTDWP